ncbi:MAG TPA: tRNA pseudouridine(55) synthase TruB [Flavobacteriales bacterium]|nr:tRNA pseudouridine(55) synthase TruB [Flavobacteriales bacterium]HRE73708.1 tRNA pseudouridine(55) synthase TruB [Flavobacteriales bacterium]HRJ34734.1 tRNA pseudouridine(55) synthase TruB [Flavobacteriales bacterium]HRJ37516.1 tRNA pseudouridine(55) synthase TruB [Flavobacteriales bacterium]
MKIDLQQGEIWLVDKPYEWTSFDVLRKLKPALIRNTGDKKAKIGHAGTLDPLATGLLIICVGKATKKIDTLQSGIKEYTGSIFLGATTPSYDRETEVNAQFPISGIGEKEIRETAQIFLGKQEQQAPVFSAKMIDGKRAYDHARKGTEIEMKKHEVEIYGFEITSIELPLIHFKVTCSKGTYIRSLAHDFGKRLNSGGYLFDLRRTKSGNFDVENAETLQQLLERLSGEKHEIELDSKRAFLRDNRK